MFFWTYFVNLLVLVLQKERHNFLLGKTIIKCNTVIGKQLAVTFKHFLNRYIT